MSSILTASTKWKGKPIGGGHGFENRSELTTRVGSTPTSSTKRYCSSMVEQWPVKPQVVGSNPTNIAKDEMAEWQGNSLQNCSLWVRIPFSSHVT